MTMNKSNIRSSLRKSFEKVVIDAAYSDRSITFALRNGLLKFALISETFD